jgi:hypothetical protein
MSSNPWPFDQPPNCAVFTLRSIVFENEPILLVVHDEDDHGWQFLDGQPIEMANAALVSLSTIVKHDPSVLELANLPVGWQAVRATKTSPWKRMPRDESNQA